MSGNVRYLPSAGDPNGESTDLELSDAIEGELLTEEENAEVTRRFAVGQRVDAIRDATERVTVVAYQRVRESPYPARVGKSLLRTTLCVAHGVGVVYQRRRDARSNTLPMRMARAAEARGDHDKAGEWWDRSEKSKADKHKRLMDWLETPGKLAAAVATVVCSVAVLLLVVGGILAWSNRDVTAVVDPFVAIGSVVAWVFIAVTVAWLPLALLAGGVGLVYLWSQGRNRSAWEPPKWLASERQQQHDHSGDPITPGKVVLALRDLKITELRKAIHKMDDGGGGMLSAIVPVGCGVEVDVYLPPRVTAFEVQKEHPRLAGNLDRHEHELFISIPPKARSVRLLIADSGALDEPIGQSPLVTDEEMTADYYTGRAPWGETLRGGLFSLSLLQRHILITGLSNQGKTCVLRVLVLWLMLDATVELRLADLKGIGDWHMFKGIATCLIEGPSDDHVIAATEMVEAGVVEMERRLDAVDPEQHPDGVDRQLARSGQGFHPLVLLVDEAQLAFMCPAVDEAGLPYGGKSNKSRFFMGARKVLNQGRAVNVILWLGTQDPTDQNLPKMIREAFHVRASLVLGTIQQARMAVGAKAVDGGAAPHKLRQDLDKGTIVIAGAVPLNPGESSVTVRTNFINGSDSARVAERIKKRRGEQPAPDAEARDLLADVATVLGGERRIKTTDVAARLRRLAPHYEPYHPKNLNGKRLAELLTAAGVRITELDGTDMVYAERIHAARTVADEDEEN